VRWHADNRLLLDTTRHHQQLASTIQHPHYTLTTHLYRFSELACAVHALCNNMY
jgi:hypothetical protein